MTRDLTHVELIQALDELDETVTKVERVSREIRTELDEHNSFLQHMRDHYDRALTSATRLVSSVKEAAGRLGSPLTIAIVFAIGLVIFLWVFVR